MRYVYYIERVREKTWTGDPPAKIFWIFGSKKRAVKYYDRLKEKIKKIAEEEEYKILEWHLASDNLCKSYCAQSEDGSESDRVWMCKTELK